MNKLSCLNAPVVEKNPDILIIGESWANSRIANAELSLPGLTLMVRKDRQDTTDGRGGGLLIYVKECIKSFEIETKSSFHQLGGIKIGGTDIFGVYRPPGCDEEDISALSKFVEERRDSSVIIGDVNFPAADWDTFYSPKKSEMIFIDAVVSANMTQLVEEETHAKGNILDIVLTNVPTQIESVNVDKSIDLSDHFPLEVTINLCMDIPSSVEEVPDFKKANYTPMKEMFEAVDWHNLIATKSATESWVTFRDTFKNITRQCIPTKVRRQKSQPMWMNKNVLRIIRKKQRLWDNYRANGSLKLFYKHREQVNLAKQAVSKAKSAFEQSLAMPGQANAKKFFSYMKTKTKNKEVIGAVKDHHGKTLTDDSEKCEAFNKYFSSVFTREAPFQPDSDSDGAACSEITDVYFDPSIVYKCLDKMKTDCAAGPDGLYPQLLYAMKDYISYPLVVIFNISIQSGIVLENFKTGNICPIFKKGSRQATGNYRPISLISVVGKLECHQNGSGKPP